MLKLIQSIAITSVLGLTGCAITATAPNYVPSPRSTARLQAERAQPAKVGDFSAGKDVANTSITLRASTMVPAQGTYAKYLAEAIRQELELVRLYSPSSNIEIGGVLLQNEVDTGVADKATGVIEAQFTVRRDGIVRFDRLKTARIQWQTEFVGAIAIPRAQQEYPRLVQALVAELFSDPEFVGALK